MIRTYNMLTKAVDNGGTSNEITNYTNLSYKN